MPQKQLLQSAGDGTAVPAGYIGQIIQVSPASNVTPGASGATITLCQITLTPGVWQVHGKASWLSAATPPTGFTALYGGLGIGTPSNWDTKYNFSMYPVQFGSAQTAGVAQPAVLNITSNTIVYLQGSGTYTAVNGAVWSTESVLTAIRIA